MDTTEIFIGLLAALIPGIGYVAPLLRWLHRTATDNGLQSALARTDNEMLLAHKLDTMGEHDWAAETRDVAQARPLKILIGFEINRKYKWWTWLTILGPTVYVVATVIVLVSVLNFPPQTSVTLQMVGGVLFIIAVLMFATYAVLRLVWFERRLNQAVAERITRSKLRQLVEGSKRLR